MGGLGTTLIDLGAGAAIGAASGGGAAVAAGANIDWNNRQLHPSEETRIQALAKQMAEQDQDELHLNPEQWAERLRIAAASRIDAQDTQTIDTQLAREAWSNRLPGAENYLHSLNLAATAIQQEATQNTAINWPDGSPIIADGAPVHAFQASEAQYRDHKLFGDHMPAMTPPYIAENTLNGYPTNILPNISRYGGQEQEQRQELLKIAGEHWKNRRLYDYEANLNRDYSGYTGTGEIHPSYPALSLLGTGLGKAGLWAGGKTLEQGLSRVAGKQARQLGGRGLAELGGKEGAKGFANKIGAKNVPKGPKVGSAGGDGAKKPFSNKIKDQARAESNDTCVFCGTNTTRQPGSTRSEIDHAIPKSRGGNNSLENAQNTCRTCNRQKGAKTTEEFLDQ